MKSFWYGSCACAVLVLMTTGCGGSGNGEQHMVSGSLTAAAGKQVPASGKVMAFWVVFASSPDYQYKFGEGTSSGSSFWLDFPSDPPADALNNGVVGISVIALTPSDATVPDGQLTQEPLSLGAAGDYAIIFKKDGATLPEWIVDFPLGYSCGKCKATGGTLDEFEPTDCSKINIVVDDPENIEFCNWT